MLLMDFWQDMIPDGWLNDVRMGYGEMLTDEMIINSVQQASAFFNFDNPMEIIGGEYSPIGDMVLEQIKGWGITEQDGLELMITRECTNRVLQGMESLEFNSHGEELCCDYMAGVRAWLNGIDISQMEDSLRNTPESETHPAGTDRVGAIEAGLRFVQNYHTEQNKPPTFDECLDDFRNFLKNDKQEQKTLSFKGVLPPNNNSDQYIPDGKITLERTVSGSTDTFKVYNKDGGQYVYEGGKWIRVDGNGTVNIKGVEYDRN